LARCRAPFSTCSCSCKHEQEQAIRFWALDLTAEDDELLTEQGVFGDELRLGTGQIREGPHQQRATEWPRPLEQVLMEPTKAASERASERDEQTEKGMYVLLRTPFSAPIAKVASTGA
jgi:hypothetical protein